MLIVAELLVTPTIEAFRIIGASYTYGTIGMVMDVVFKTYEAESVPDRIKFVTNFVSL